MESPSHETIIKLFGELDVGARLEILDDADFGDGGVVVVGSTLNPLTPPRLQYWRPAARTAEPHANRPSL